MGISAESRLAPELGKGYGNSKAGVESAGIIEKILGKTIAKSASGASCHDIFKGAIP